MWVYVNRKQAIAKDLIIPKEVDKLEYFVGHFAMDGFFYYSFSFEKLDEAMWCVNYLNGGTGDRPAIYCKY